MSESHRALLLRALRTSDHPLDDDELSDRMGIRPRQAVNRVLRMLELEGHVRRTPGPRGKLVTLMRNDDPVTDGSSAAPATAMPPGPKKSAHAGDQAEGHALPPGSSGREQRDAERVMLDMLGQRIGRSLEPARLALQSGVRVEVDGADGSRSVLVECWAHQGPPKGGQKHKVLANALKLTWIAATISPRPELVVCLSDQLAAAPFLPSSKSWASQALVDLGIRVELVQLPDDVRSAVSRAQIRQRR